MPPSLTTLRRKIIEADQLKTARRGRDGGPAARNGDPKNATQFEAAQALKVKLTEFDWRMVLAGKLAQVE